VVEWKVYKFSDFLIRTKIPIIIDDLTHYKRVTIKSKHGGVSVRDTAIGAKIGTKKQFILKKGQFVLSKIDARYGAFGISNEDVDQAIITGNFWAYNFNENIISIKWLNYFTNSLGFYELCERASSGITYRKYLNETVFLNNEIVLPPIENQDEILIGIDSKRTKSQNIVTELTNQKILLKKLRQQILQEAIEGKLTKNWRKQNPNVESASKLLKRIHAEKEQLIKDKQIKKQKPFPPINKDEKPFNLPDRWVWCRTGSILNKFSTGPFGSMLHKSDYVSNGIPLVNPTNIINGTIVPNKKMMIDEETRTRLSKYALKLDELVVARRGDLSKCAIVSKQEEGWLCGTGSFFIQPAKHISKEFFIKVYTAYFFQKQLADTSIGQTMANLNQKILNTAFFPLPSFAEQKAIVNKVDKLFAICEQLEGQTTSNQNYANALMQSVLKEAFSQNKV
jgi:type I restriction enzyme S subunit